MEEEFELLKRLTRDQAKAASTLGDAEARFAVDYYYQAQHKRIAAANQSRSAEEQNEPHTLLLWMTDSNDLIESQLRRALGKYAESHLAGEWALSQKGIGPVLAAGFVSRLTLQPTVGHWWRFCGLDPTTKWEKGQKRPWCASLKRLCWLTGQSFMKVSGREDAYYGQVYLRRKELEMARNEAGLFFEQAAASLLAKRYGADTVARAEYEKGRLPQARILLRAQRYAVKLFLSHMHDVWHRAETGEAPPMPYPIAHLGHAHYIPPPIAAE